MRVTQNTNFNTIRSTIHDKKSNLEKLQIQASSMKKLNTPSDDPIGASRVLEIRSEKLTQDQYLKNSDLSVLYLEQADQTLDELSQIVLRAKDIALNQSSGSMASPQTRVSVSEEVRHLVQQAISGLNAQVQGRYLFSGQKIDKLPFSENGQYLGDQGQIYLEVSRDVLVSTNIPGDEVIHTSLKTKEALERGEIPHDLPENHNLFETLKALRIGLMTNDTELIRSTLEDLDALRDHLVGLRARVGSRLKGIESSIEAIHKKSLQQSKLSSQVEDADLASVASEMSKEEGVLKATLASSKNLIQPTLIDFLR